MKTPDGRYIVVGSTLDGSIIAFGSMENPGNSIRKHAFSGSPGPHFGALLFSHSDLKIPKSSAQVWGVQRLKYHVR